MQLDVARQVCSMQLCHATKRHTPDPAGSVLMPHDTDTARTLMSACMTGRRQKLHKILSDTDGKSKHAGQRAACTILRGCM